MNIAIPNVDAHVDARRPCDANDIYKVIRSFMAERLYAVPLDEFENFVAMDPYKDPDTGVTYQERIRYELRPADISFSESAVAGRISQLKFTGIVHYSYDHALTQIQQQQPNGQWELIAVEVDRENANRTVEIPYQGPVLTEGMIASWIESPEAVGLKRKIDQVTVPDYRCRCQMVFCDVARGDIVDPNMNAPNGVEGPMTRYGRTRSFRHLTEGTRQARAAAVALVRRFAAAQSPEISITPAEVEIATTIVQMRKTGTNPRQIAKALNITEAQVKAALRETAP